MFVSNLNNPTHIIKTFIETFTIDLQMRSFIFKPVNASDINYVHHLGERRGKVPGCR